MFFVLKYDIIIGTEKNEGTDIFMNYYLNAGCWETVFAVPGAVVDNYIKLASGSAVKVLLYLLRNNSRNVSRTEISAALNISGDDVSDAFNFWEGVGILSSSAGNTAVSAGSPEISSDTHTAPARESLPVQNPRQEADEPVRTEIKPEIQTSSASFQVTPSEIDRMRENSKEMKGLFDMAQVVLGNTINHTMVRSLVWQHEYLGLKPDVILMLLSYCSSIGKTHTSYIETIAVSWSQNDINSLDKAEAEIARLTKQSTFLSKMTAAFGLRRQPTPNQQKFFDEWMLKGFSADLVSCACERATDLGKTLTTNYVNGILESWRKKGISTREQAEAEISSKKSSSGSRSEEQSYDISRFDELAITHSSNTPKRT